MGMSLDLQRIFYCLETTRPSRSGSDIKASQQCPSFQELLRLSESNLAQMLDKTSDSSIYNAIRKKARQEPALALSLSDSIASWERKLGEKGWYIHTQKIPLPAILRCLPISGCQS